MGAEPPSEERAGKGLGLLVGPELCWEDSQELGDCQTRLQALHGATPVTSLPWMKSEMASGWQAVRSKSAAN